MDTTWFAGFELPDVALNVTLAGESTITDCAGVAIVTLPPPPLPELQLNAKIAASREAPQIAPRGFLVIADPHRSRVPKRVCGGQRSCAPVTG
jgi:hypothetical protein